MPGKKKIRIRVGGIVVNDGKVLLVEHTKGDDKYWLAPGGGVDFCEDFKTALAREFMEELNISVEINDVALISDSIDPSGDRHVVNICFLCTFKTGDFVLGEDERLYDFRFFDRDELAGVEMFPPINNDLINIINGKVKERYIGKLWK